MGFLVSGYSIGIVVAGIEGGRSGWQFFQCLFGPWVGEIRVERWGGNGGHKLGVAVGGGKGLWWDWGGVRCGASLLSIMGFLLNYLILLLNFNISVLNEVINILIFYKYKTDTKDSDLRLLTTT